MLELSIPQLDENSKNTKDIVFTILTRQHPLSLIQIHNKIKQQYNLGITYQAVRKSVDTLHTQGVLDKQGKEYSIKKEWILNLKSFFDKLLTKYETGKQLHTFRNELAKENYAVYTFNNLLDLDNFWGNIMNYWANHEKNNKNYLSIVHYHWWMIINLGKETALFENFKKKNIKSTFITLKKAPLNNWAKKIYQNYGMHTKSKTSKNKYVDINVLGDTIIQVEYPKKIANKIEDFFKKYKNLQEVSPRTITQLAHKPCEIKFIMFKSSEIAQNLRYNI